MKLFAIADLHLPGGDCKPMDVFGPHWEGHFDRIREDWRQRVTDADAVLLPGDLSWAMHLREALPDLEAIAELPGRKLILKGNHDYWWPSISQLRTVLPAGMEAIQHSAADLGSCVVCGTRGWMFPSPENPLDEENERIFHRELIRLEMALREGRKLAGDRPLVVMTHYPPLLTDAADTAFTELLSRWNVRLAVYGHLHGAGIKAGFNGNHGGVEYRLVSCDALDFHLAELTTDLSAADKM